MDEQATSARSVPDSASHAVERVTVALQLKDALSTIELLKRQLNDARQWEQRYHRVRVERDALIAGPLPADPAQRFAVLHEQIAFTESRLEVLRTEHANVVKTLPSEFRKKFRPCLICRTWTTERFSARSHDGCTCCSPQCHKHTASKDEEAKRILASVIYGDSE